MGLADVVKIQRSVNLNKTVLVDMYINVKWIVTFARGAGFQTTRQAFNRAP